MKNVKVNHERRRRNPPARTIKLPEWDNIWKFTIVRNPYDRFISGYYHLRLHKLRDINDFILDDGISKALDYEKMIFNSQTEYLYDGEELLVDYVGRYEYLDMAWNIIKNKLGIKENLSHHNQTNTNDVKLTEEAKRELYKYYLDDFKNFGYE